MPAAFFDVDGTLASSNVLSCYLDFQLRRLSPARRVAWLLLFLPRAPYYACLDALSRDRFNRAFFHNYRGVEQGDVDTWATEAADDFWQPRLFPQAVEQLARHRAQGHRIVLVSGGVAPALEPLARLLAVDSLVCARLEKEGSRFTGRLVQGPLAGPAKAAAVERVGEELGLDLGGCYAYADSYADREFLERVGNPSAVNPDRRLFRLARARGWPVRRWAPHGHNVPGASRGP